MSQLRMGFAEKMRCYIGRPEFKRAILRVLTLTAAALGLASCVASERPLLTDAKPILGNQFKAQLFRKFSDGRAHEVQTSTFRWQDGAYVNVGGGATKFQQSSPDRCRRRIP